MMFLPEDQWSPRYEEQFYTIRMKKYTTLHSPAEAAKRNTDPFGDDDACSLFGLCNNGKKKYPAVYYEIEVLNGTTSHTCLRRYSQFHHLCKKLDDDPSGEILGCLRKSLPPKTAPFHKESDDFLEERMVGLHAFLRDLLIRQECVNNPLIEQFLELNGN
mmetsp:Transcript_32256/g.59609  ORF Transcript_32256/g.59609 Transcript_32256/m.59609 type:complete len:160 (-) Transcript_32256:952-1431(-)|eukprot:CAMPEP_0201896658 /NCGR_PEP_ID=MMETSP0902-20130614/45067_1 /ASSEMBLY_ACC=CAM_ASM_000551 /TAXON_ID=420261 /ORGANISM="Thalassiosira antarctica, Strain CCMP982" /LENGTH=159 /DNA_ID=CAMNT_0048429307 /DNA_START=108 /DNA_END=587 /DNA_ORIENTATION=+